MTEQYKTDIRNAANAWRGTDTYGTAAIMIDDLLAELEKCQKSQSSEPLSLDELMKMNEKPIWVVPLEPESDWIPHWCIFHTKYDQYAVANSIKYGGRMYFLHPESYNRKWIAYTCEQKC